MGKSSSKMKPAPRRSQSMAWSFRFATLNKNKMTQIMVTPQHPHLDIGAWLDLLDLRQYHETFSKFIGVEELIYFCEADIKQLGVRNSAHRARIVSSLVALRDKHERASTSTNSSVSRRPALKKNQRYSMGAVPDNRASRTSQISETPTYELLVPGGTKEKQSKSLGDLLDMEQTNDADGSSGGSGATTPSTPTQETLAMKKALEWELSLDSRDLRSHAWYYSAIPRQRAEEIVEKDGDFLVRDCVSQPGNYVLTCKAKGVVLHFVINKVLIQRDTVYERVQYQFEDDAYDTVPDLITFYVGSGKTISAASGAYIQFPCNRTYPLSFYAAKYGNQINQQIAANSRGVSPLSPSLANVGFRYTPYIQQIGNYNNSYRSPMSSPPRTKRDTPPRLPSKKQRSQSLTPIQPGQPMTVCAVSRFAHEKYCSADGVIQDQSHSRTSEKCSSADGVIHSGDDVSSTVGENGRSGNGHQSLMSRSMAEHLSNQKPNTQSLPRLTPNNSIRRVLVHSRTASLSRDGGIDGYRMDARKNIEEEEEATTPTDGLISPPPKPIRSMINLRHHDSTLTLKDLPLDNGPLNRVVSYHASESDSGNGSGDSAQSSAANDPMNDLIQQQQLRIGGVVIRNPRFMSNSTSSVTLKSFADLDYQAIEENLLAMEMPAIEQRTKFDLENYHTLLLPAIENKPLDNGALSTFRIMLSETAPRIIANHITRIDIKLILGDVERTQRQIAEQTDVLDCTGIELIAMSHGEQFRKDLIERTECIRLLVAVTILTCSDDDERAETLNKWIQIAIDIKTALGNLFGFSCIMLGICMPQVQKLETTWHTLRQKYTESAFNFEAKLRPTLKNMNNCTNPQAPNTTVPHILPYVLLKDRNINDLLDFNQPSKSTLISTCVTPWETNADDFGLSIILAHLDSVRIFTKNLALYQRNAQIVMTESKNRIDELLEDSFRTEFHLKFLWGSKGALASAEERHLKLEQVLSLMAEKFCNVQNENNVNVHADQAG